MPRSVKRESPMATYSFNIQPVRFDVFSCATTFCLTVLLFTALLKTIYAGNVHIVLSCPYQKASFCNPLCVLISFLKR